MLEAPLAILESLNNLATLISIWLLMAFIVLLLKAFILLLHLFKLLLFFVLGLVDKIVIESSLERFLVVSINSVIVIMFFLSSTLSCTCYVFAFSFFDYFGGVFVSLDCLFEVFNFFGDLKFGLMVEMLLRFVGRSA